MPSMTIRVMFDRCSKSRHQQLPWYVKRVADWLPLGAQKPIASMGRCPFVKC
jgi:hypothetical protein